MRINDWNLEHITLVGVTLYFILCLLALAAFLISKQIKESSKTHLYVQAISEVEKSTPSLFKTTAVRLLTCWLFAISAAFLAFTKLQCRSEVGLPPYLCSLMLQFFLACEVHFLMTEQMYNRLCLVGTAKKPKYVVVKFIAFSIGIPVILVGTTYYFLGPRGFIQFSDISNGCEPVLSKAYPFASPPTIYQPNAQAAKPDGIFNQNSKVLPEMDNESPDDVQSPENCWITWMSMSVRVTSVFAGVELTVGILVTWMNVVKLLRIERRGTRVAFSCWWGVAARIVIMVITMAKWASVAFQSTCSSNLFNVYASIISTPILLAVMFCGTTERPKSCNINSIRLRKTSEARSLTDVIELTNLNEASVMLHHDVVNGDVTPHVTHEKELYVAQKFFERGKAGRHGDTGEMDSPNDYNGVQMGLKQLKDRHSADVDDGVISNDGDYDTPRPAFDTIDVEVGMTAASRDITYDVNENKSSSPRLSHAESTDSGMGFSDNAKDCDNTRLSDNMAGVNEHDNYGTIRPMELQPLDGEPENRKSLIDGDAEYDEVMDFITTPTEIEQGSVSNDYRTSLAGTSVISQRPERSALEKCGSPSAKSEEGTSKYAELDLAKILHTRRRHKHILTTTSKEPEDDKPAETGIFDSLKRKSKSKNYSFVSYATYGRNRKQSRQPSSTDVWISRPSSTCNDNEDPLSPLSESSRYPQSGTLNQTSNYTHLDLPLAQSRANEMNSRFNFTRDLMMTSDVNEEAVPPYNDNEKRLSWRSAPKSPPVIEPTSPNDDIANANRWSWVSNSSQTQPPIIEKTPATPSKSPWNVFRRLFGVGSPEAKGQQNHKPGRTTSTMSSSNLSTRSKSSLFRRLSMKKSVKSSNPLNKRRNSVPTKSEWDVRRHPEDDLDSTLTRPLGSLGISDRRPSVTKAAAPKLRNKIGSRLMSFRGSKGRNSKYMRDSSGAMAKGLSISSPQLAVHAIDPTRNYSEHQLLTLNTDGPALR